MITEFANNLIDKVNPAVIEAQLAKADAEGKVRSAGEDAADQTKNYMARLDDDRFRKTMEPLVKAAPGIHTNPKALSAGMQHADAQIALEDKIDGLMSGQSMSEEQKTLLVELRKSASKNPKTAATGLAAMQKQFVSDAKERQEDISYGQALLRGIDNSPEDVQNLPYTKNLRVLSAALASGSLNAKGHDAAATQLRSMNSELSAYKETLRREKRALLEGKRFLMQQATHGISKATEERNVILFNQGQEALLGKAEAAKTAIKTRANAETRSQESHQNALDKIARDLKTIDEKAAKVKEHEDELLEANKLVAKHRRDTKGIQGNLRLQGGLDKVNHYLADTESAVQKLNDIEASLLSGGAKEGMIRGLQVKRAALIDNAEGEIYEFVVSAFNDPSLNEQDDAEYHETMKGIYRNLSPKISGALQTRILNEIKNRTDSREMRKKKLHEAAGTAHQFVAVRDALLTAKLPTDGSQDDFNKNVLSLMKKDGSLEKIMGDLKGDPLAYRLVEIKTQIHKAQTEEAIRIDTLSKANKKVLKKGGDFRHLTHMAKGFVPDIKNAPHTDALIRNDDNAFFLNGFYMLPVPRGKKIITLPTFNIDGVDYAITNMNDDDQKDYRRVTPVVNQIGDPSDSRTYGKVEGGLNTLGTRIVDVLISQGHTTEEEQNEVLKTAYQRLQVQAQKILNDKNSGLDKADVASLESVIRTTASSLRHMEGSVVGLDGNPLPWYQKARIKGERSTEGGTFLPSAKRIDTLDPAWAAEMLIEQTANLMNIRHGRK